MLGKSSDGSVTLVGRILATGVSDKLSITGEVMLLTAEPISAAVVGRGG